MRLNELLTGIYDGEIPQRFKTFDVKTISYDSRIVEKNSLFIALKGTKLNGADFIYDSLKKGARIIICAHLQEKIKATDDICILNVKDPRGILLSIAQRFYNYPSAKVHAIGITGTNGKTTVSYLLESLFNNVSKKCAVIGTVNYRIGKKIIPSKNTTPGLLDVQRYLALMAEEKVKYCAMEVSSHALDQGRVDGVDFACAIFTNLTGDHMDYHQTMDNYFVAKSKLFTWLSKTAVAVINVDDAYGQKLVSMTKAKTITYGLNKEAQVTTEDIKLSFADSVFMLKLPIGKIAITTPLIGRHNIYNILAASAAGFSQGLSLAEIKKGVEALECVPGRLEQVKVGQKFSVFVDYAHTEDALKNVLSNLKAVSQSKIILVFGCGGDRDTTKRPKMGKVASQLADYTIITSDNPRSESPQSIIDQVVGGFEGKKFEIVIDRKEAIKKALQAAQKNDVVLIAGKGHEDYQIFKDKTVHFDDREVVRELLNANG